MKLGSYAASSNCNHGNDFMVFSSLFWLRLSAAPLGVRLLHLLSMALAKVLSTAVRADEATATTATTVNGGGEIL